MPAFETPEPILATVEITVGDLRIAARDRSDTVVEVRPANPSHEADVRAAAQTRVEMTSDGLLVKGPKQRALPLFGKPGSVDVSIDLKVYDSGDHTCLVWLPLNGSKPATIPGCRGFAIRCVLGNKTSYLHGFVGFSDADKLDPAAPWKFPLQRYMWWDYDVAPGDVVQYAVVPVVGPDKDHLQLSETDASAPTPPMTITGQATPHVSAYFNKGIVAAQWVSRALAKLGKNAKLATLIGQINPPAMGCEMS